MRDSDRDFRCKVVVRKDAGIRSVKDLLGKTLAVGSRDSTQARILPLHFLATEGVDLAAVKLLPFDTDLGKHGDTGTSELDVLKALRDGARRPASWAISSGRWSRRRGASTASQLEVLWTTPGFDHCMFDGKVEPPSRPRSTRSSARCSP